MKFGDATALVLQVILGILVTVYYFLGQILHICIPRMRKSVQGEIVLVTGAGHGLGRRIALHFGRRKALVVCWDKNTENNQNTMWDIRREGGQAISYTCDVTDMDAVFKTAALVREEVGHVTMLVNNAGIYPVKSVLEFTPEELHLLFNTNIMAHFWTLKAFMPAMIERNHGHVVAMSSAAAIAPVAHEVPYSATKSAVTGLMDGVVQELRLQNSNVKVTCVHPYYTACRNDLPVKFDLRIDRLSPDYVASEIVKGILEERESISVPRFMLFWISLLRCLPQRARHVWRDIFYTRVWPEPTVVVDTHESLPEAVSKPRVRQESALAQKIECSNKSSTLATQQPSLTSAESRYVPCPGPNLADMNINKKNSERKEGQRQATKL